MPRRPLLLGLALAVTAAACERPEQRPDPVERDWAEIEARDTLVVLASYNVGRGHVLGARRLTEKHGGNPLVWEEVAYWLLQKSRREVYTDPVVRHGYAGGLEPVTCVARILDRHAHYHQLVVDPETVAAQR